ncbi:hypothetical protein MUU53_15555 [Rhizobium lemnae]|uniref:DUF1127 domain-containing protein n=1 Tax=Rhizobium lemnae TaxID=1214924 RepID=A0ABV8E5Y9_9HYPH|nr:hypothetical protein [Rhizobium lemnae]MCJ8509332.1 hypothetical protein [Rhizobium lemnae]
MAFASSQPTSSSMTETFVRGSFLSKIIGKTSAAIAAHRKRKALAILEALPIDVRKDIGWQTGN